MNITEHIVTSANWDEGRGGKSIIGIVLHTMVGYMQGSEDRFNDPSSGVSVHYGVGMDGSVRRWVEEANTAWQAGNYPVNQTTIGIEHEDNGNANDSVRTPELYESSAQLVADICKRYNFPADPEHIFLHKNVIDKTRYPGGTACPDGLDTNKIISMAQSILQGDDMNPLNAGDLVNIHNATGWPGHPIEAPEIAEWVNGTDRPAGEDMKGRIIALLVEVSKYSSQNAPQASYKPYSGSQLYTKS